jgi:hypothetical protein
VAALRAVSCGAANRIDDMIFIWSAPNLYIDKGILEGGREKPKLPVDI